MKAVKLIDDIDAFVEKHMTLMLRVGGLFVFFFFVCVAGINTIQTQRRLHHVEQMYQEQVQSSNGVIGDLSDRIENLNKRYAPKMVFEKEAKCLADNIYYEIGTDDREGMLAVAQVTLNRTKYKYFAKTVCGVVYQKTSNKKTGCQFSWVCRTHNNPPGNTYQKAMEVARKSLTKGVADSRLYKALYYHAEYVNPSWAESKTFMTQIGPHLFYAEASRDN